MIGETVPTPTPSVLPIVEDASPAAVPKPDMAPEIGGRDGPEPTRYGDWEKNGRCIDF